MKVPRLLKPLMALALMAGATVAIVPAGTPALVSAAPFVCDALCAGGEYHPIEPLRIFDSRPADQTNGAGPINDVAPFGRKLLGAAPNTAKFNLDLLGLSNPSLFQHPWLGGTQVDAASDVLAVVASVTVVNPSQPGFLKAYAKTMDESEPNASLLNFAANRNVSNLAILRPDASGMLTIALRGGPAGGAADVVIDVFGWFSTSSYNVDAAVSPNPAAPFGARLVPVDPARIEDTRLTSGAVPAASTLHVPIRGAVQLGTSTVVVPNDPGVVGVVLNVTGVTPTSSTFLSVLPAAPSTAPTTSNVNLLSGAVKANLVIVPVKADTGDVWVYNHAGSTDVVIDVVGYLQTATVETTRAGRVVPLTTPFRAFDTRSAQFGSVPLGPRQAEDWSFAAFSASVNIGGVSVGLQSALIGNLTNAALGRQLPTSPVTSFLTVYPRPAGTSDAPPTVSNLNSVDTTFGADGVPVPNMALVRYKPADQTVRVFNYSGYADYLLDVSAVVLADPLP